MRVQHPGQTGYVITLSEDEAKRSYHEVEIAKLRLRLKKNLRNTTEKVRASLRKIRNRTGKAHATLFKQNCFKLSLSFDISTTCTQPI